MIVHITDSPVKPLFDESITMTSQSLITPGERNPFEVEVEEVRIKHKLKEMEGKERIKRSTINFLLRVYHHIQIPDH